MSVPETGSSYQFFPRTPVPRHLCRGGSRVKPRRATAFIPSLESRVHGATVVHVDHALRESRGILVAFSERTGGVSAAPFASLNLASHVGDDPRAVDENRRRLLEAAGCPGWENRIVTAEQVHGTRIATAHATDAGSGAYASAGTQPLPATDAILTAASGTPLLMMYADCVPVVLVAPGRKRAVAVVHAGWKGALARLPGRTAVALAETAGCAPCDLLAYIGPYIGGCCYEVDDALMARFRGGFDTAAAPGHRLDLGAAVRESLAEAGVPAPGITGLGTCTRDHPERFFSYRAAATTGRHGALAAIIPDVRVVV